MDILDAYIHDFLNLSGTALVGKVVSIFALILQVYALACPVEKTTKTLASVSSIGWSLSFFIAGSVTASFMAALSAFRQAVSSQLVQAKKTTKVWWSTFFFLIGWVVGFLTYKDTWSLLPVLAGTCSIFAYFYCSNLVMRWMLVFSGQLWLLTHWKAGVYEGVVSVLLSTIAALIGIYRVGRLAS